LLDSLLQEFVSEKVGRKKASKMMGVIQILEHQKYLLVEVYLSLQKNSLRSLSS